MADSCIRSNNVMVIGNRVYIDGKALPPCPSKSKSHSVTTIDKKVYINGYEFKNGKWKKTLKALYHKWF